MGNLCSSGTDRSEKKEDNNKQIPKAKDDEDEAQSLLTKAGEATETLTNDQSGEGEAGGGGGLSGFLGGVVESGEDAVNNSIATVQTHGEEAAKQVKSEVGELVQQGKDSAVEGVGDVAATVKASAEESATKAANVATEAVESGRDEVSGKVENVKAQASAAVSCVQSQATELKSQVSETVESGHKQAESLASGVADQAQAVKEESVSALENSKAEATSVATGIQQEVSASKNEAEATSGGFMDSVKQTVEEKVEEAKDVAQEKGEELKVTAEGYISQAVDAAKTSAAGMFSSAKETTSESVEQTQGAVNAVQDSASEGIDQAGEALSSVEKSTAETQDKMGNGVEEIQACVTSSLQSASFSANSAVSSTVESASSKTSALDALASDMMSDDVAGSHPADDLKANLDLDTGNLIHSVDDLLPPVAPAQSSDDSKDKQASGQDSSDVKPESPNADAGVGGLGGLAALGGLGGGMMDNFGAMATGAVATGVGIVGDKIVDGVKSLTGSGSQQTGNQEVAVESALESTQQGASESAPSSGGAGGMFGGFGAMATTAVESGVGVAKVKIIETVKEYFDGDKKDDDMNKEQMAASQVSQVSTEVPHKEVEGEGVGQSSQLSGMINQAMDEGHDLLMGGMTKEESVDEPSVEMRTPAMEGGDEEEASGDFLEKAKSLLDYHRNSLDGGKVASQAVDVVKNAFNSNEDDGVVITAGDVTVDGAAVVDGVVESSKDEVEVHDEACKETAREFVEGIIDKASTIVSESMEGKSTEDQEEEVENKEESIPTKKRGVCFASPQGSASDHSITSPSSPPHNPECDLSPPSDASSISQGELVERDIEMELPDGASTTAAASTSAAVPTTSGVSFAVAESPEQTSTSEEEATTPDNNDESKDGIVLDNQRVQNMQEADDSLQRIAQEVTTKAVQDAIKIVTENGTGLVNANDNNNEPQVDGDVATAAVAGQVVSSPSSTGERDEEEMTTTDSSQVERGSSVSDLTDTSQQGSITESLSSYDPGAVYRQDINDLGDVIASATSSTTSTAYETNNNNNGEQEQDSPDAFSVSLSLDGGADSVVETTTPTNQTSFSDEQDLPPPPPTESLPLSSSSPQSEVPSTFPTPLSDPVGVAKQPTIVINSPDSAPNTNGSLEDVSAASSEALI